MQPILLLFLETKHWGFHDHLSLNSCNCPTTMERFKIKNWLWERAVKIENTCRMTNILINFYGPFKRWFKNYYHSGPFSDEADQETVRKQLLYIHEGIKICSDGPTITNAYQYLKNLLCLEERVVKVKILKNLSCWGLWPRQMARHLLRSNTPFKNWV